MKAENETSEVAVEKIMMTRRQAIKTTALAGIALAALPSAIAQTNSATPAAAAQRAEDSLDAGWSAWEVGDIDKAEFLARRDSKRPEGRHLLFLCTSVKGHYEEALEDYAAIESSYNRLGELDQPVIDAYMHLERFADARAFAERRRMDATLLQTLALHSTNRFTVCLNRVSESKFVTEQWGKFDLSDFLPPFSATINGQDVLAHVDTGGTFLHMNPDHAKQFGIELIEAGEGYHGTKQVKTYFGIARNFHLGDAEMENVPVLAVPSLGGGQDFVVFGTNILERFLATLDYPNKRMILSLRGNARQREEHLAKLPAKRVETPFYVWGDHFMFARGTVGGHPATFFIDSGLLAFAKVDKQAASRQIGLLATPQRLEKWGIDSRGVFDSPQEVSLGPVKQTGLLIESKAEVPGSNLGGIRTDGLLSHAFLSHYTWTIDFDDHRYLF